MKNILDNGFFQLKDDKRILFYLWLLYCSKMSSLVDILISKLK